MICPICQTKNPQTARFCSNCGHAFMPAASCPNCGENLLPNAKFCHNCGYALTSLAQPTHQDRLQKYFPKELLRKLQTARLSRSIEGERRIVTMLFCDVTGSTSMAEVLDPEDWAEIMNGAFEYMIPPIFHYEGIVPRLLGDAILAFFGAPIAHEDDPERAVRAGLEIVDGIREYHAKIQREHGLDFDVRVGINTGLVVVGQVGTDLRLEYTAMGDAINLAARMEQTALPGTVQISQNTYQLVAPLFEVEPLGGILVKGKSEPVEAYRVIGIKSTPIRHTGIGGLAAPLVGRKAEMAVLRRKLAEVSHGRGGIVCLIGEAGLGKSRLIEELKQDWEQGFLPGPPGLWSLISSASFAASRPYGQLRQHILDMTGIRENDPPEMARAKIDTVYQGDLRDLRDRAISVYSVLLGIDQLAEDNQSNSYLNPEKGETFKQELFDLVLSFERKLISGRPGVVVFEDLHWLDPASAELLVHLLQLTRELPVLFLFVFRPEPDSPVWMIKQVAEKEYIDHYDEITLAPLQLLESQALLEHLLLKAGSHPDLLEQILGKAGGNPLFIEEVVRELLDRGDLETAPQGLRWKDNTDRLEIVIPDSLQALLMSRLDRLDEDARQTLQLASVIGRSFYYRVLKWIIDAAIELDRELHKLQMVELIRKAALEPEVQFEFRHALTQEAAYSSILVRHRRKYHRSVAEALEAMFSNSLEEHADLLAHHFYKAGDSRAGRYYFLAGNKAAQLYVNQDALAYFTKALEIPGGVSVDDRILTYEKRGEIYFAMGHFKDAAADFESALALARDTGRTVAENRLMSNLAWLLWSSGKAAESLSLAQEAEARSQASGNLEQAVRASIIVGSSLQNIGDIQGARGRMRQAVFSSRRQGDRHLTAMSLYYLAMQENFIGRFGRAAACAHKSYKINLDLGNRLMACGALFSLSMAEAGRGRYDQALSSLEDGRLLAEEISSAWLARYPNQRAWLSAELGDWETAYAIDLAGLHPAQDLPGFREIEISTMINLVLDCTALGLLDEAASYLAESQKDLGRPEFGSHNWRWSIRIADASSRLAFARGDLAQAAQSIASLQEQAKRLEARKYLARGLVLRAESQVAENRFEEAEANLLEAVQQAACICYLPTGIEARLRLSQLYKHTGSGELAEQSFAEASKLVKNLDQEIRNPELRSSFKRGILSEIARKTL